MDSSNSHNGIQTAIELLNRYLDQPIHFLESAIENPAVCRRLRFDHVGVMVAYSDEALAIDELTRADFHVTERFDSIVVATYLRAIMGDPNLSCRIMKAIHHRDRSRCLEVFVPSRPLSAATARWFLPEIAHVAFRPLLAGEFDDICDHLNAGTRCTPFLAGDNPNQRNPRGRSGAPGVSLRYFSTPSQLLGRAKLELVTNVQAPTSQPGMATGPLGQETCLPPPTGMLPRW